MKHLAERGGERDREREREETQRKSLNGRYTLEKASRERHSDRGWQFLPPIFTPPPELCCSSNNKEVGEGL